MKHQRHFTLAEHVSVPHYFAVAAATLALVFAWLEPTGASGIGFIYGLLFWSLQMALLFPLLISLQKVAASFAMKMNPWVITLLVGGITALLFAPFAYLLDMLFGIPEQQPTGSLLIEVLDELRAIAPPVIVVWLGLNAPWILGLNFRPPALPEPASIGQPQQSFVTPSSPFVKLVASEIGGEIISLSSELHYLRVRTTSGSGMLLYNLRDAVADLAEVPGIQIHRSHWVANKHIERLLRKDGQQLCLLSDGTELPVSRRRQKEVQLAREAF